MAGKDRPLPEFWALGEGRSVRKSKNKALPDLVEFSMFTGVRRGEGLALTWDRVDRARGVTAWS